MDKVREDRIWRTLSTQNDKTLGDALLAIRRFADSVSVPPSDAAAFIAERFGVVADSRSILFDEKAERVCRAAEITDN